MEKERGFSLVELVIVIVIIGILSVIAMPIYMGHVKKAMATEGKALLGAVFTAQRVYYSEFNQFITQPQSSVLGVDPISNRYFTAFTVTSNGNGFTAVTSGVGKASGIGLTLTGSSSTGPFLDESGL